MARSRNCCKSSYFWALSSLLQALISVLLSHKTKLASNKLSAWSETSTDSSHPLHLTWSLEKRLTHSHMHTHKEWAFEQVQVQVVACYIFLFCFFFSWYCKPCYLLGFQSEAFVSADKERSIWWQPRRQLQPCQKCTIRGTCQNLRGSHWKPDGAICRGGIWAPGCDAKWGRVGRKEKNDDSPNFPKSPLPPPSWFTGNGMLFFSPSSLRRSSSWQAAGSGPGLMFVCGTLSSLPVEASPANVSNYVRQTCESLLAVRGRAWVDEYSFVKQISLCTAS